MIVTQRQKIPWSWTMLLAFPCGVEALMESVSGMALTYSLWKFTQDPVLITFLGSLNVAFNFLVAPLAAWHSDRIWSSRGRRIPFILVGLALVILSLLAIPLASAGWMLIAMMLVYYAAVDLGFTGPWPPLYFEIIPPAYRSRAVVIKRFAMIGAQLLFNLVLIRQFDRVYQFRFAGHTSGITVTGEQVLYGVAALMTLAALVFIALFIREEKPSRIYQGRFNPKDYIKTCFCARRWPLYLLAFSSVAMTACLGQLQPLLITEQFGYSKQILGSLFSIVMILEIFVTLPIMALLANRVSRLRLYQLTIALSAILPLAFWLFIKFIAPGQIPAPSFIVTFMVCHTLVRTAGTLCIEPLFFDNVPPDEMGTAQSGLLMVRGLLSVLVLNGVGWWVKIYSWIFPSGGPMKMDYTSAYLYIAGLAVVALVASFIYAARFMEVKIVTTSEPTTVSSGMQSDGDLEAAAATRPALTRPGLMGGPCCHMK